MPAPHMQPFVLSPEPADRERRGTIDVHTAPGSSGGRRPVVVFVHGGPIPPGMEPGPRDWPTFLGYGALAAASGLIGVTIEHRLRATTDYPVAAKDVESAVEQARGLDGVDPDAVALWFFSGGSLLAADWLAAPPPWLRCVAFTYPALTPPPGWGVESRFDVAASVTSPSPKLLLTRVGHEFPEFVPGQDAFVAAAGPGLEIIEVPDGQHGFDSADHTEQSRSAVTRAMTWVAEALHSPSGR
ncbi:alpha/beta hydrolase [Pseudonocardia spinosispora]|uniref:alpha/beta hydrolase n=1 Tax=Pseudonocardia spinosispora TaxID=103441 RepID=UPI001B7FCA82|nr:hypothetical protein [Pseudonocardia spinosispora]